MMYPQPKPCWLGPGLLVTMSLGCGIFLSLKDIPPASEPSSDDFPELGEPCPASHLYLERWGPPALGPSPTKLLSLPWALSPPLVSCPFYCEVKWLGEVQMGQVAYSGTMWS